jgi:hypothetical protein
MIPPRPSNSDRESPVSWLVLRDNSCVPISITEDLLSDTGALIEDVDVLIRHATDLVAEARMLVARSRERRDANAAQGTQPPDAVHGSRSQPFKTA